MVKVAPPKDWAPPQSESISQDSAGTKSKFDFDDIDELLAKPERQVSSWDTASQSSIDAPAPDSLNSPNSPKVESSKVQPPAPDPEAAPRWKGDQGQTAQPLLPDKNWESEKSKGQKAWLRIVAAVLGSILLAGFIFAIMTQRAAQPANNVGKKLDENANQDPNLDASLQPGDSNSADTALVETETGNETDLKNSETENSETENSETENSETDPPVLPIQQLPSDSNPLTQKTEPQTDSTQTDSTQTDPTPTEPSEQASRLPSPFRNSEAEKPLATSRNPTRKQAGVGMVTNIEKQIGDLSGLLEQSGTSLSDLQDATIEAAGDSLAGIPKYVIEKPGSIKSDLERLNLNVGGLLFEQTPLPVVARELSALSGVPITIDARAIEAAGKEINQRISATIKDTDLNSAMDQILAPLGITKKADSVGLKFTVAQSKDFKKASHSTADFSSVDAQAKQNFIAYIQGMIAPEIWVRPQEPAEIELQGDDLVAKCPAEVHAQIDRLFSKLLAANALISAPTDLAAINQTLTRSAAILPKLEAGIENQHTIQLPIGLFLTKLQSKSSVTVVVDWENLAQQGWNPQTLIPGNIDEPTTGDVVKKLVQSMNLSVVAIDDSTLMLTTPQQAANTRDIEVYPVSKLLAGKFDEDRLKEAFATTLGYELRNEKYVYDSSCQCFIVAASQAKQRQVAALLKRLEGI